MDKECVMDKEIKRTATEIANLIEDNDKDEANAIISYNFLLEALKQSDLSKSKKEIIESKIYEIIGDELNHQDVLKSLYSLVTEIKENKD